MSDKPFTPPDAKRTIHVRIISHRTGLVRFGEPKEDASWVATENEAYELAKSKVADQTEAPESLQVHIKNHENGEVHEIYSDPATHL